MGTSPVFDFDHAMRLYLGGAADSSEIQIGLGSQRLEAEYADEALIIQSQLDAVLEAAVARTVRDEVDCLVASWLAAELPSLSSVCRRKIESYVWSRVLR